ncbi:hypothetical protein AMTRI_Chr04g184000 [Amborella trichopoda]
MTVRAWSGRITRVDVPLDEIEVILGLEFRATTKVLVVPSCGATPWCIDPLCDELCPCMIPNKCKGKGNVLSALQVKTGLQHGQATYLATLFLNEAKEDASVPLVVEELLKSFANVMPPELPKSVSLRRVVDQRIELEEGAPPQAPAPYQMAPSTPQAAD